MNFPQQNKPIEWVTDVDEKYLTPAQAFYLKNREFFINIHGAKFNGQNLGTSTPMAANYPACELRMPGGENYSIGTYSSNITNEVYIFVLNSNTVSFIYRVDAKDCHIVYDEPCYTPSAEPKNAITQWRVWLDVKETCKNWAGKRLFFTDGIFLGCIDVEASIATDSFTTDFFKDCSNPCDYISLCTATPFEPIRAEYLPKSTADKLLPNKLVDIGFQFMYRWVYYDGRTSVWSEPSTYYYQSGSECLETEDGFSRCLKLRIPAGNAMVSYIELAYRTDNFNQWKLAESIEKYRQYNNAQQQWYERQLSPLVQNGFSTVDCAFDYIFCNDKECLAISPSESGKVFIPFPREAQGLMPFKDSILFYNYKSGNCPLPRSVIDNVKIELDCSNTQGACNKLYEEVTVYAVIHEFWHDRNQFIYTLENDPTGKTRWFGGLHPSELDGDFETGWNQRFTSPVNNFIAYIEGTEYFVELKQFKRHPNGTEEPMEVVGDMSDGATQRHWRRFRRSGGYCYSKGVIRVPKGTKGFVRLTGHQETFANEKKSTFVEGVTNLNTYNGEKNLGPVTNPGNYNPLQEEIYFDTCHGPQDLREQAFVIKDNAIDGGNTGAFANKASAASGYVFDNNNEPIPGANVYYKQEGGSTYEFGSTTDHNGFYHVVMPGRDEDVEFKVRVEKDCSSHDYLLVENISLNKGEMSEHDFKITNTDYTDNKYVNVKFNVVDCAGNGVPGIRVAISGNQSKVTDNFGAAKFKLRNYYQRNRKIKGVIMDKKGCIETDCYFGICNPCMPSLDYNLPACFLSTQIINLDPLAINTSAIKQNGTLKAGGRYGFGAIVKGDCGQLSFVNKGIYLDIPKKCGENDDVCNVKYDLTDVVLPGWAKSLTIVRTKNLNPFELQWVVDKAEYKDNKITLTIQSLNDYNFKNFFETNTIYQYLKGDRVEIIADEKGKYYCQSLNYQILSPFHDTLISGDSKIENFFNQIIIEDDGRIGKKIVEGTIIELQRPQECQTEEAYYSIGAQFNTILQANGTRKIANPIGIFTSFDTYIIRRKIGKSSTPKSFEHHSPSDFWGDRISDIGQPFIVNKFEDEVRKDRNITISSADDFNYFGDFVKTIGDPQMGGLVAGNITDDKVLLWICENDNFINQTADDLLKVVNGMVSAASGDDVMSNPQPKLSGKYGCQYAHIGSIFFGDGFATWADVNKHAYIKHNYQEAEEVSFNKIKAWTSVRFQQIETWNRQNTNPLDKYRFATGYNHLNKMVYLTLKQLRHSGIDNAYEPYISPNETIIFRPEDDKFYGQSSCTPEAYGMLNSFNGNGSTHITIQNGIAWLHPIIPQKVGSFFGVPVDQVIGICLNKYPEKIKTGLSIETQDSMLWFAYKIKTDNPNFESEIPAKRWVKTEYKHSAEFLCNKNGRGGLYGNMKNFAGEKPNGYFISVIFIRDNTQDLKYQTIDNNKRQLYSELDMITFKFLTSEQSGFDANL